MPSDDHQEGQPNGEAELSAMPESGVASSQWLSRGVVSVGLSSLFSDSGHEIATAVLPSFITSVLHGSAASLGLIEAVSDALTGVAKVVGGPLSNDARLRGRLASSGYLGTALATGAIGLAGTVWQAGILRAIAWASRGLRSPARDSLLASFASEDTYGRAFGLERAGDNLGAVIGPLLAAALVVWVGIRPTIYFAFVPGIFAAVAITVAAREASRRKEPTRERIRLQLGDLHHAGLVVPLLPVAFFEFGNIATTLLILRSTQLLHSNGRSLAAATSLAIIIYAAHNAIGALVAYAGGHWVDRVGPLAVLGVGACLYIAAYVGFSIGPDTWWGLLIAFILAGSGIGLAETAESALVAQTLPDRLRGSGFGILGGIQAVGDLVATGVVGILYTVISPAVGFAYAAGWMGICVVMIFIYKLMARTSTYRGAFKS